VLIQCGWHLPNISLRTQDDQRLLKRRDQTKALGPEKLYVSKGKVLKESVVSGSEKTLKSAQRPKGLRRLAHKLMTWSSSWRTTEAANVIVSSDNSALHLAVFIAGSDAKFAILLLRPGKIYVESQEQLRRFAQVDPVISDCCKRFCSL